MRSKADPTRPMRLVKSTNRHAPLRRTSRRNLGRHVVPSKTDLASAMKNASFVESTDPDLAKLKARGGKLLLRKIRSTTWHRWARTSVAARTIGRLFLAFSWPGWKKVRLPKPCWHRTRLRPAAVRARVRCASTPWLPSTKVPAVRTMRRVSPAAEDFETGWVPRLTAGVR